MPIHKILDEINEKSRGSELIGTTKKGIGPAYEDKVGRRAIRLCDLNNTKLLKSKINKLSKFHQLRLKKYNIKLNSNKIYKDLLEVA